MQETNLTLARDLERKFREDLYRACKHYTEMCQVSGVDLATCVSTVLGVFTSFVVGTIGKYGLSAETFCEKVMEWDKDVKADKAAEAAITPTVRPPDATVN